MFWSKRKPAAASDSGREIVFELFNSSASNVYLCGDFNSWSTSTLPLKPDNTGRWKTTVRLKPGRYEYRFFVDGEWCNDQRPVYLVDNPFGTQNCLIEI